MHRACKRRSHVPNQIAPGNALLVVDVVLPTSRLSGPVFREARFFSAISGDTKVEQADVFAATIVENAANDQLDQ